MIKLNSDLTQGLDIFNKGLSGSESNQASARAQHTQFDTVQFNQSHQQSFTFFYRSVHSKLEQSLQAKTSKLEQEIAEQQLAEQNERADVAANNILKFIEHQLKQDVSDGADKTQLASRIDAALEGFDLGFEEANDVLSGLNLLSPELGTEIGLTKEKVLAGIDAFKAEYLGETSTSDGDEQPVPEPTEPNAQTDNTVTSSSSYAQQQAGVVNDFSFELTTADGDKVTINASALTAQFRESGQYTQSGPDQQTQMSYLSQGSYRESHFAFSVEGELDEGELKAINNLLNQVNDLAGDFYQGDVGKAFDKALEMNYDSNEISQFSISLTHIKNFTAFKAYQTDKPIYNASAINQLKPLADFTNELVNVSRQVEDMFAHPRDLITDVMKQITQLQQPLDYPESKPSFVGFADKLLDSVAEHLKQLN